MPRDTLHPKLLTALTLLIGTLVFSAAAFWNGYPLLFQDSATYIADGFAGVFIAVRSVFYPLFVKITSLSGLSLWYVIFAQNLMLSFGVWSLCRRRLGSDQPLFLLMTYVFASLVCGAAWIQGQVMADAFTPIAVLSFILILLPAPGHWVHELAIAALFVSAALAHISHLLLVTAALPVMLLLSFASHPTFKPRFKRASLAVIGAWILASLLNFGTDGSLKPVESYQPHLIGRLAESGVLGRLLSEHCAEKKYLFCGIYPSGPISANDTIWKEGGLLSRTRGHADNAAYREMILDSVLKYPGSFLLAELKSSMRQLVHFRLGDRLHSYAGNIFMENAIQLAVPEDREAFLASRQQTDRLDLTWPNRLLGFSLLASILVFLRRDFRENLKADLEWIWALGAVAVCIVLNAVICAGISRVADRYQARVIWLWPLMVWIAFLISIRRRGGRLASCVTSRGPNPQKP